MTKSVRICLSYDPLNWDFITYKMNIISINNTLLIGMLSMTLCVGAKVILHVYHMIFMTPCYPLNYSDIIKRFYKYGNNKLLLSFLV